MTDLTEQWKKGELPSGWYYVQLQEGVYADNVKSIIMDYYTEFCDFMKHPYLIEEVLAPVPSYDEWQAKLEENAQLKELLKECKMPLKVYNELFGNKEELLTKIDEVLK